MASDPVDTLEQQNGGGHRCISPPLAPIIGGRDPENRMTASIQERLDGVPPLSRDCCIYRVPEGLRKINEEAYTPHFVSIGPFHHGKENLKVQETLKWQHLHSFIGRNSEVPLSQYVKTIKEKEERIRKCYAENITGNSDEFVKMMLVDGCFILEHIISVVDKVCNTNPWFLEAIGRDLILLENQLPFFVLEELYKLNRGNNLADLTSIILLWSGSFASGMSLAEEKQMLEENCNWSQVKELLLAFVRKGCSCSHGLPRHNNINEEAHPAVPLPRETSEKMHLLDFVRDHFIPSSSANNKGKSQLSSGNGNSERERDPGQDMTTLTSAGETHETDDDASRSRVLNCTTSLYPWNWSCFNPSSSSSRNKKVQLPHNVTALHKAGVKLQVGGAGECLLDVSFENGVLAIPCIIIDDSADSLLRNMIAFEQLYCVGPRYITDYATLLDRLIDTSKDVELLHDHGIIKHLLGDHKEVSLLFNKLVKEVVVAETDKFCFYGLCQDLNAYHRFWRGWMADLRQTYLKTPWKVISVIAGAVLILLTILQTIYSIKSYIKQ